MTTAHSKGKRAARLHYRVCPRCGKRYSDLEAHYREKHAKNDRKRLKAMEPNAEKESSK
jgi:4-hydroxy-3-methylbut-2-en-1-yl diphosphate synthase IspG/GcpE